MLHTVLSV
jgi:hypothetical protein